MSDEGLSRREFVVGTSLYTASAVATSGFLGTISPAMANQSWPYVQLNPVTVMQSAYDNYWVGGCMYGTGAAVVNALATSAGGSWPTFNPDFFRFGAGGVAHWGSLCGSLNGACAVIELVAPASATAIINELFGWYTGFPFPSTRMDSYARWETNQPTNQPLSLLCHNSAGRWAKQYGQRINSNPRRDRCAKLSGDVAYQTVVYLNAWKNGTFQPTFTAPTFEARTQHARCINCHGAGGTRGNMMGRMGCLQPGCHPDKVGHKL